MDCEMVGMGHKGSISMLGRVALVNHQGHVLLDTMVEPLAEVTDYRTKYSGLKAKDFLNGTRPYEEVLLTIKKIIEGRILVGHGIKLNDLKHLRLSHPELLIRDSCEFSFCPFAKSKLPSSLKKSILKQLNIEIQKTFQHCPVEDARAAMALYQSNKEEWEEYIKNRTPPRHT